MIRDLEEQARRLLGDKSIQFCINFGSYPNYLEKISDFTINMNYCFPADNILYIHSKEDIENRRFVIPVIDGHVKIEQYRVSKFLKEGYTF